MSFDELSLSEQYRRLQKLRVAAIVAALGDDAMLDRVLGDILDDTPEALPDAAEIADAVGAWLAGGAA